MRQRPSHVRVIDLSLGSCDQAVFGIDIIAPKKFGSTPIDLVVPGPNEGQNNGPFLFTLSGTIGATYVSVERGVRLSHLSRTEKKLNDFSVPGHCILRRQQHSSLLHDAHG